MLSFLNLSYKYTKINIADMIGVDHMEKFVCTRAQLRLVLRLLSETLHSAVYTTTEILSEKRIWKCSSGNPR